MITEATKTTSDFKAEGRPCPDCGDELIDDVCPVCNPEEIDEETEKETGTDLGEELV